ncbi:MULTISPECIES: hypothetical protein [Oscillatoriales]|uniref:hypothetical protein n=1 Tax=Oscillatoriales TaxID=1150 RepID=UPI0001D0EFEF|nr:hypothetical protein [Arthrospira platensis NCB002]QQW27837.1 hypothetical protein AP9108_22150 [Arthrospira sp. PCC 9108]BAI92396.1 hypothetical protein NIES39_L02360 [Arthrospira platensis NIES-39]
MINSGFNFAQNQSYWQVGKGRKRTEKDGSLIKKCKNLGWLLLMVDDKMFPKRN